MPRLQLRQNLAVPDLQSYYTSLWTGDQASFSSSQESGWLTDLEMVGRVSGKKEIGWGSVKVHKAVIFALSPFLFKLFNDVDDFKVIFVDVQVEVIKSVVKLLYTGECTLSPMADVTAIMDLVMALGIDIQPARLQVDSCRSEDVMNSYNHATRVEESFKSKNVRGANLLPDETEFVFSPARRLRVDTADTEDIHEDINDNSVKIVLRSKKRVNTADTEKSHEDIDCNSVTRVRRSKKRADTADTEKSLEYINCKSVTRQLRSKKRVDTAVTEDILEDFDCNSVTRVLRSKKSKTSFCCDLCSYECMFWTQLLEHSKEVHAKKKVEYKECDTKSSKMKHYHAEDLKMRFTRRRCRMCVAIFHNQSRKKAKNNLSKTMVRCQVCLAAVCRRHTLQICKNCAGAGAGAGAGTWDVGQDGGEEEGAD